jgi:uncharacterized membrane protein
VWVSVVGRFYSFSGSSYSSVKCLPIVEIISKSSTLYMHEGFHPQTPHFPSKKIPPSWFRDIIAGDVFTGTPIGYDLI